MMMVRRIVAAVVCAALVTTGCASAGGPRIPQAAPGDPVRDTAVLADYVQRLSAGSKVRVEQTDGTSFRGTLMRATAQSILVQKNTRVPEAPVEIPLDRVTRVTLDNGSSTGRSIVAGVSAGVAVTFGVLLLLAVLFADS
jgi:hypothetical protein